MNSKLHPFRVLEYSLLLVWRHKKAFTLLIAVLWLLEDRLLSLVEAEGSWFSTMITAYLQLELLRVVLVTGTYRALPDRTLSVVEIVTPAFDGESWVRALRVAAVVGAYTMFLTLWWLPLYELAAVLRVPPDETLTIVTLVWLIVEVPLFVLIPVAALESHGVWHIFRDTARLTAGSRLEILQLSLMLGPGVILPYGMFIGAVMPEVFIPGQIDGIDVLIPMFRRLLLGIALVFAAFAAVVTTVCYRELRGERATEQEAATK
jgi:hypothetical protein